MRILDKNGLKYVDEGKGTSVLFLHGWGVSPYSCQLAIDVLASKYRVVAPFFKSFKGFTQDEETINSLFSKNKIIVIGHSAGGISAAEFCSRFPEKVKALVLVDTVGAFKDKSMLRWIKNWLKMSTNIVFRPNKTTLLLAKDFFHQIFSLKELIGDSGFVITEDIKLNPNFPVLILWGGQDDLIDIKNGYNLQKSIQGSEFKEVKGNHYWFLANPKDFLKEIDEFINKI
jgi:pimeloyl-ACP methyl ester carboxylesterase